MRERLLLVPLAVLLCFVDVVGQAPATADAIQRAIAAATMVPLHTHPSVAGQPDYGWWAGGPSWEASFHDGLAFYPYRGSERERVQLHWRTAAITAGGEALPLDACGSSQTDDCYQTHYPGVTELYELSEQGVEQKFVFDRRPARPGAIVVTGRLSGDLEVASRTARHDQLLFSIDGQPTVRYGKAFAIDADGRQVAVPASVDGVLLQLHVPAEFVAAARFPLTLDPLVGNALINSNFNGAPATSISVACSTALDQMVVTFVRKFAANDLDAYSLSGKKDFTAFTYHWIDNSASWTTPEVDVAYCAGERSYVIAFVRAGGSFDLPYLYVQRDDQMQNNTGATTSFTLGVPGNQWAEPSVGGGYGSCGKALAMWTFSTAGSKHVTCAVVDCANPLGGLTYWNPSTVLPYDEADQPDVTPMTRDGQAWRIAWHAIAGGEHEIRSADVAQNGGTFGPFILERTAATMGSPQIAGTITNSGGLSTVLVWERAGPFNPVIRMTDFSLNPPRAIATGPLRQIRGTTFVYPTDAQSVPYGTGCSPASLSAPYPFAGNHNFEVTVGGLTPNTPMVLAVGVAAANVSLQPLGIPCPLLVSPSVTYAAVGTAGAGVSFPIPLPDDPVFVGDLYVQAILPFASQATAGMRIQVR